MSQIPGQYTENQDNLDHISEIRYYTPAETASFCGISTTQLFFWEQSFPNLKSNKSDSGRRRFKKAHMMCILEIKRLLFQEGLAINEAIFRMTGSYPKSARKHSAKTYIDFDPHLRPITQNYIVNVCDVHPMTARKYMKERKAPPMACKLLSLYSNGRVLPDSWKQCFINHRGKLEFHDIGEVCENEVLNMQWMKNLHRSHVDTLQKSLANANARIAQLEQCLTEAREQLGDQPAANDQERTHVKT